MDPHALSGLGRNAGFHSPGVCACFPTSPRLVVQPDRSRGEEDVHVTRPQFPLQCPLFWSWSPKPSQLSLTACPHHVLGQTVPENTKPLGGQTTRKWLESNERKKAFQGLFCLCLRRRLLLVPALHARGWKAAAASSTAAGTDTVAAWGTPGFMALVSGFCAYQGNINK